MYSSCKRHCSHRWSQFAFAIRNDKLKAAAAGVRVKIHVLGVAHALLELVHDLVDTLIEEGEGS